MACIFSAYGIGFRHPKDWSIYINPNKSFTYEKGEMRAEYLTKEHDSQVTITVTWEYAPYQEVGFGERYIEQVEQQYKKTLKKNKRYHIISKEIVLHNEHEACVIHSVLNANTHAIRPLGKNVNLEVFQLALYCAETERIIVSSITCTCNYFEGHKDELEEILLSLTCH